MRPYVRQQEAIDKLYDVLLSSGRALVVMATGLGKTPIAAFVTKYIEPQKVLFLCHQGDILEQAERDVFSKVLRSYSSSFFSGRDKDISGDIVFATFQSITRHLDKINPNMFDMIIVDESHHSRAYTYEEALVHFRPTFLLGMTATKDRMDGLPVEAIFGEPVVQVGLTEAIGRKWLTPFRYKILSDYLDNTTIKKMLAEIKAGARLTKQDIDKRLFIEHRDHKVAEKIRSCKKKGIIFCRNIRHANRMAELLPKAAAFHSRLSTRKNKTVLENFRSGKLKYIVTVDKMNEGIDVPEVGMVAFLRSTASKTIFLQQLGRALRKKRGKKEVLVLDFVATVNRIILIDSLIPKEAEEPDPVRSRRLMSVSTFEISGEGYEFAFDEGFINMLLLLQRLERNFYLTWQEAQEATQKLGIRSKKEYEVRYREDPKLPSDLYHTYEDFPGNEIFFGPQKYKTWQEASIAVKALGGITTMVEYLERYKEDPLLPSQPARSYKDFPGWNVFLGRASKYDTWEEASEAVVAIGKIGNSVTYQKEYRKDPRLPAHPETYYEEFPGWDTFLRRETKYPTWQEAAEAVKKLGGFASSYQYQRQAAKKDPRLHTQPPTFYGDFPGWDVYLGRKKGVEKYKTWREASKAAQKLGATSSASYIKGMLNKEDPRLPGRPDKYYDDFPGWKKFLGKK